jgi:uncharacterized SAM-binding protein YcdF (DUF218 family)
VVLLARGKPRPGLALVGLGVAALVLCGLPAVSNRLWRALEDDAPTMRAEVTYDAVVLLGGVVSPLGSRPTEPAWSDNIERLLAVRELLLSGKAKVAILSGGAFGVGGLTTEADYLAKELEVLGVPADRLIIEREANNTRENATLSKPLLEKLGAKEVLLVTSAFHMPRAAGCFRAVGVVADTLPVDYRVRDVSLDAHLAPRGEYFAQTARALREWLGRLVYRVMGYAT